MSRPLAGGAFFFANLTPGRHDPNFDLMKHSMKGRTRNDHQLGQANNPSNTPGICPRTKGATPRGSAPARSRYRPRSTISSTSRKQPRRAASRTCSFRAIPPVLTAGFSLLASAIARETRSIKFCVAIRPGLTTPTFAVQQANTLDFISGGRLTVNVVPGGSSVDARRYGDWAGHDGRYERADEFLDIVRAFWADGDGESQLRGRALPGGGRLRLSPDPRAGEGLPFISGEARPRPKKSSPNTPTFSSSGGSPPGR